MEKDKEIMSDLEFDSRCMLMSLPLWDLENFMRLVFVAQSVPEFRCGSEGEWFCVLACKMGYTNGK